MSDVLSIGNVARSEQPNLFERVEPRAGFLADRRELETDVPALLAVAGRPGPVLSLDVVDHGAPLPAEQCRDDQAYPFPRTGRSEGEYVLIRVVAQVGN